jgi:DNA invertase Pin-like site-specific DNA recombinase
MKYIAYYRKKQPASPRFNVKEQREAVARYHPIAEFIEIEARKGAHRSALAEAVAYAKKEGAVLVIAKMEHLSRAREVTHLLMESGVEFICVDQPTTNRSTIHVLAAVAEENTRERLGRLKETFAKQKARGVKLGSANPKLWKGREHLRNYANAVKHSSAYREQRTKNHYQYIMPIIQKMREEGTTFAEIADWLNANGHQTTILGPFTELAVWRIVKRYLGKEYLGPIKSKDHPLAHVVAANEAGAPA